MNKRKILGIVLGGLGLLLPWFIEFPGLSFPGHVTLGVFLMAACFWLLEPVPIYTTSLLVIFLEVLLLSAEGPLCKLSRSPAASVQPAGPTNEFLVPVSALTKDSQLLIPTEMGAPDKVGVEVLEKKLDQLRVRSLVLSTNESVITQPDHWRARFAPVSYRIYFGALADPIIILFMGGCLLANASVKYRLDRSLTQMLLRPLGSNPALIVLGLLVATGVLSAFMSNTATTAMMMTVVLPILAKLRDDDPLRFSVVLAVPIGANIGGIATPIGTPPNAIALAGLAKQGIDIPFIKWVIMTLPVVVICLVLSWLVMMKLFRSETRELRFDMKDSFDRSAKAIGLYVIFGLTALLWFTENQHGIKSNIVAFLPVVALPMLGIISKKEIQGLPWDVLWLMAGGISLGTAIRSTGLAVWLVDKVQWSALGVFGITAGLAVFSYLMANFLSHTVTVTLLTPIAVSVGAVVGAATGFDLTTVLVALAVASSFGMALPISTPPNAIAMSAGVIESRHLLKAGGIIGLASMVLVLLMARFYWPLFN